MNYVVSWSNTRCKAKTRRCPLLTLSRQVSLFAPNRNLINYLYYVDEALAHVPRDKIREQLLEVGFDNSRQTEIVGGLSGGWKMKLELARAMLYNADLLLLDEVGQLIVDDC
jgi:ATPase subunit of ABC transporter with duplicated ATPase domains